MSAQPPSATRACHWTIGAGSPVAAAVNVTGLLPADASCGCLVIAGAAGCGDARCIASTLLPCTVNATRPIVWAPTPMFRRRSEPPFSRLLNAASGNAIAAVFQVSVFVSLICGEFWYAAFGTAESYWMFQLPVPWSKYVTYAVAW